MPLPSPTTLDSDCSGGSGRSSDGMNAFLTRQPSEPTSAFLTRLVPTQTASTQGAWIYIDNPDKAASDNRNTDWRSAIGACSKLLSDLTSQLNTLDLSTGKPPTLARQKQLCQSTIASLKFTAAQFHATIGKWILFYPAQQINHAWARVATATSQGKLGVAAKVNTTSSAHANGSRTYVICVYTHDFRDREDVRRVLVELFRLGLTPTGLGFDEVKQQADGMLPSPSCSWKPDLYTYLGIDAGNEWGIEPTLYRWQELVSPKSATTS